MRKSTIKQDTATLNEELRASRAAPSEKDFADAFEAIGKFNLTEVIVQTIVYCGLYALVYVMGLYAVGYIAAMITTPFLAAVFIVFGVCMAIMLGFITAAKLTEPTINAAKFVGAKAKSWFTSTKEYVATKYEDIHERVSVPYPFASTKVQ
jgi:hypothetical protein